MLDDSAFQGLIRRVRAGNQAAAEQLVRLYEPAIRRAARVRLTDARLRQLFDSADVCQSVLASFFVRAALGQFDLDRPAQLLSLLADMSRKKVADHARAQGAARRDYRRSGGEVAREPAAPGPSPSQEAALGELLVKMRGRLSDEERELAERRAQGQDWAQIAQELGGSAEALRKKLARAVERAAGELGLEGYADA